MRTLRKRKGGPRLPVWPPPPGFFRAAPASQGGPRLPDFSGWAVELRGGRPPRFLGLRRWRERKRREGEGVREEERGD